MTYYAQWRQHDPRLSKIFVIFVAISLLVTVRRYDITPFFVWNFFAKPTPVHWQQRVFVFVADGDTLDYSSQKTPVLTRLFVTDNLRAIAVPMLDNAGTHPYRTKLLQPPFGTLYAPIITHITNPPSDLTAYAAWLKTYLAQQWVRRPIARLQVIEQTLRFDEKGGYVTLGARILFDI